MRIFILIKKFCRNIDVDWLIAIKSLKWSWQSEVASLHETRMYIRIIPTASHTVFYIYEIEKASMMNQHEARKVNYLSSHEYHRILYEWSRLNRSREEVHSQTQLMQRNLSSILLHFVTYQYKWYFRDIYAWRLILRTHVLCSARVKLAYQFMAHTKCFLFACNWFL